MKYSVACCYLTHNHPDIVKEVFDKSLQPYADHGIDVCICDDSDNLATKTLVEEYVNKGYTNLYYVDMHEAKHASHKLILVFKGDNLPKDYDYLWICKDRVCFTNSYLEKLCTAIDEGHDVIMGTSELSRWDVGIRSYQHDTYTDPAEFYRRYAVVSTNWEATIRKRETMLAPIDWDNYLSLYGNDIVRLSFDHPITLFTRLAELDSPSMRICRYEPNERFISAQTGSSWRKGSYIFELWIDKWVAANYALPSIYDPYKAEAIKSETNLSELFGSVEYMIYLKDEGTYTREIFEKYRNIWPFVTDIPVHRLGMIADGDYQGALQDTVNDFHDSIANHMFGKAWWILASNGWFEKLFDKETYMILVYAFNAYRQNMMHTGASNVFDGVNSVQDIIDKYKPQ